MMQSMPLEVAPVEKETITLDKPKLSVKKNDWFHHLSRMLFSCLVDADYLDTEKFMDKEAFSARSKCSKPDTLFTLLENFLKELNNDSNNSEVNSIRQQVQEQCRKASDQGRGFYSLTVPTGGGKTLSSVLWAMKHAIHHGMKRIIIAIPYTSIIVQTAAVLKKVFGEDNVLEHHCNFDPSDIANPDIALKAKLATENWDYPIVVTTNVQLFESLFSNRPSACRKLHNITNSVIILDEVQTLPTDFLKPIVEALVAYQQMFGVSVLFTTASQPLLSGIIEGCNPRASFPAIDGIREIIPPELELHKKLKRVDFAIDNTGKTYDEVAQMISKHNRVLCIVNTRRDAKEIYSRLPQEGVTLHLSRMMCPSHIAKTIEHIRTVLKDDRQSVVRVVATQLIEAGVDIDFPIVFRQEAGLDSILQAAGRCNREGHLKNATTFVFSLSKEHLLYGGVKDSNQARLNLGDNKDWLSPDTMIDYFKQLYSRKESFDKKGISDLLNNPSEICFESGARAFHLIEDSGVNVIVNYGNSLDLIDKMKEDGISYLLMKQLSQFTVSIHKRDFEKLQSAGFIDEVIEGIFVITYKGIYKDDIGLCVDGQWLEEILIS